MNTRIMIAGLAVLSMITMTLGACAPAPTTTPVPPTRAPSVAPTTAASSSSASSSASITVTDSANRTVTIPASPQRIVSLTPSTTEILFALGLGKRIVAVDKNSDFPAEAKDLPKIQMIPVNFEQVVSFKPDLVLAASITKADDIKKMQDLQLTVLVVGSKTTTFDNIMADIQMAGKATGSEAQAKTITDGMKQKLDTLKAKVATAQTKPLVYWEIDATDAVKPYTAGPGSFIDDMIRLAGGVNIAGNAQTSWVQISAEQVVAANADIIIMSNAAYTTPASLKARNGWGVIKAIKDNRVFPIDDNLVSRAGPRVVDGLEAAAKLIHPELFK